MAASVLGLVSDSRTALNNDLLKACAGGSNRIGSKSGLEYVKELLESPDGPSILNLPGGWNASTPLMIAAQTGQESIVVYLLERVDIKRNSVNGLGCNALMLAAEAGHKRIVEKLHESDNSLIRGCTKYQQTALMLAIENYPADGKESKMREAIMSVIKYITLDLGESESRYQLSRVNKFNKWPFMIASEFCKLEIVDWMLEHVARLSDSDTHGSLRDAMNPPKNNKGNNSLMMACTGESLHVDGPKLIKLLIDSGEDVNNRNNFGDTPLHYAIAKFDPEFSVFQRELACKAEVLISYVRQGPDFGTPDFTSMKALNGFDVSDVSSSSKSRYAISRSALNSPNDEGLTPLMRACEWGQWHVVELLLDRPDIDKWRTEKSLTAFHYAFLNGHIELATTHFMREIFTSKSVGQKDVVIKDILYLKADSLFTPAQLDGMAQRFSTVSGGSSKISRRSKGQASIADSSMAVIGKYAAVYDFHLDLMLRLIPHAPLCIAMLNKALPAFYRGLRDGVKSPFPGEEDVTIMPRDADLVYKLVRLCVALKKAIISRPMERNDIQERLDRVENAIKVIFRDCDRYASRMTLPCISLLRTIWLVLFFLTVSLQSFVSLMNLSMDEEENVQRALCCGLRYLKNSYMDKAVERAMSYRIGPIETGIHYTVSTLFAAANVSTYIDRIFWSCLKTHSFNWIEDALFVYATAKEKRQRKEKKKTEPGGQPNEDHSTHRSRNSQPDSNQKQGNKKRTAPISFSKEAENIVNLKSNLINGRYSPAFMFFLDGVSHAITLVVICWVLLITYADDDFVYGDNRLSIQPAEAVLIVMCFTSLLTQIGLLIGDGVQTQVFMNYRRHFSNIWNYFDVSSLVLMIIWLIVKFTPAQSYDYSKAALASSTIFQAAGMLRYSSFHESFGQFVILVMETILSLGVFGLMFLLSILGFWIFFYALFSDGSYFTSPSATFLVMFSAALGNSDSFVTIFGDEGDLSYIGMAGWLAYVVFAAVVLINLVIAYMNSTYNVISTLATEKWQLARTEIVDMFLLIYEKSALCMLPAPLNAITFVFSIVHYFSTLQKHAQLRAYNSNREDLEKKLKRQQISSDEIRRIDEEIRSIRSEYKLNRFYLSVPGSIADIVCGLIASVIAPFYELASYLYKVAYNSNRNKDSSHSDKVEVFAIIALFPLIYPLYVLSLVIETIYHNRTFVSLDLSEQGYLKCAVRYPRLPSCVPPPKVFSNGEIAVKVIRGTFKRFSSNGWAHVRVRIGEFELETGPALYPGPVFFWSQEILRFPITEEFANLLRTKDATKFMEITVIDRDRVTQEERIVCYRQGGPGCNLTEWISNKRFEGELDFFEGNAGESTSASLFSWERMKSLFSLKGLHVGTLNLYVKVKYETKHIYVEPPTVDDAAGHHFSRFDSRGIRHGSVSFKGNAEPGMGMAWSLPSIANAFKVIPVEADAGDFRHSPVEIGKPHFQRSQDGHKDRDTIFTENERKIIFEKVLSKTKNDEEESKPKVIQEISNAEKSQL